MEKKKMTVVVLTAAVIVIAIIMGIMLLNKATYQVTFDVGVSGLNSVVEVDKNENVTAPANPTKDGYVFAGWYYGDKKFDFSTKITESITLTAKWVKEKEPDETEKFDTYTVTFDVDGGSNVKTQTVESGKVAEKPTNPTKEGYTFNGWYLDGKVFDFTTKITKNVTLTAKWEEDKTEESKDTEKVTKYTVTFDVDGGTAVKTQTVEKNKVVNKPTAPTKAGYTFKGWYVNGKEFNFTTKITKNITLTAKWEKVQEQVKKYTVTFNTEGGSNVKSQTVEEGKTATRPQDPTKDGYIFKGWHYNNASYNFGTKITSNITLVAIWEKEAPITWLKEPTISDIGQVNIVVYKGTEKVDAVVDLVMNNGKVVKDKTIPKTGYIANTYKVVDVINIRVK